MRRRTLKPRTEYWVNVYQGADQCRHLIGVPHVTRWLADWFADNLGERRLYIIRVKMKPHV